MQLKTFPLALTLLLCPGAAVLAQRPAEQPEYEVMATSRGNFVAWPAGALEKSDVLSFAEKAEAELSASGSVSPQLAAELAGKATGRPGPARREDGGRHTPFHNGLRGLSARTVIVRTGGACAAAESACFNAAGAPCRTSDPGCRCACADPNTAPGAVAAAMRNKRGGVPLIVFVPEGADPGAAIKAALQSMGRTHIFLKIDRF